MSILVHYNAGLPQQVRYARAFADAGCFTTPCPDGDAEFHLVQGPHFALKKWRHHPNLILLDRAFWGDPDWVTLCWYKRGDKEFPIGQQDRKKPNLLPWKTREQSAIVLADYGQDVTEVADRAADRFGYVYVRRHPTEQEPQRSLQADLALSDVAIGRTSTALVDAAVLGLPVICDNPQSPVASIASSWDRMRRPDRAEWLHELSWRQWSIDEIRNGSAIEALMECHESSKVAA